MTTIHQLSALELSDSYASGGLSPVEVTRAIFEHIDACEPKLNAMYLLHRESAMQQAQAAEARWRKHLPLSALDEILVT